MDELEAEKKVLEAEQKSNRLLKFQLEKHATELEILDLKLNEKEQELNAKMEIYRKEKVDLEQKYRELVEIRNSTGNFGIDCLERDKELILKEKKELEEIKKEIQRCETLAVEEMENLKKRKQEFVDERLSRIQYKNDHHRQPVELSHFDRSNNQLKEEETSEPNEESESNTGTDSHLEFIKKERELVTKLDLQLQRYLLNYKSGSSTKELRQQMLFLGRINNKVYH